MKAASLTSKVASCRGTAIVARPRARAMTSRPMKITRHSRTITQANMFADVSKYLSDAAQQIFSPMRDNVPWERVAEPFVGRITHHEEVSRISVLAQEMRLAADHLEEKIDTLPAGDDLEVEHAPAEDFVTSAIDRVFGHNFKGDPTEPGTYFGGEGYRARGRTQREVRKDIERLRRFEKVLTTAVERAQVKQ